MTSHSHTQRSGNPVTVTEGPSNSSEAFRIALDQMSDGDLNAKFDLERRRFKSMQARGRKGVALVVAPLSNFRSFLTELGPIPGAKYTVDRIDNDNPCYELGNIRWATPTEQANNRSNNRVLTIDGETLPLTIWADRIGVKPNTLRQRLSRGAAPERAVYPERFKEKRILAVSVLTETAAEHGNAADQWRHLGCTPANWESYYRVWLECYARGDPRATRAVFATYICRNAIAAPPGWNEDHNGAFIAPANAAQLDEIRLRALTSLSFPEQDYLIMLRNNSWRPTSPLEAAKVAKTIR